jgi:hypothetical protein
MERRSSGITAMSCRCNGLGSPSRKPFYAHQPMPSSITRGSIQFPKGKAVSSSRNVRRSKQVSGGMACYHVRTCLRRQEIDMLLLSPATLQAISWRGQLEWPWKRCPLMLVGFGGLALACLGVFAYQDRRPKMLILVGWSRPEFLGGGCSNMLREGEPRRVWSTTFVCSVVCCYWRLFQCEGCVR